MTATSVPRLSVGDELTDVLEALDAAGAVIIEGLLGDGSLQRLRAELVPHIATADPGRRHVNDVFQTFYRKVRSVTGLAAKSPTFVDSVLLHQVIVGRRTGHRKSTR